MAVALKAAVVAESIGVVGDTTSTHACDVHHLLLHYPRYYSLHCGVREQVPTTHAYRHHSIWAVVVAASADTPSSRASEAPLCTRMAPALGRVDDCQRTAVAVAVGSDTRCGPSPRDASSATGQRVART